MKDLFTSILCILFSFVTFAQTHPPILPEISTLQNPSDYKDQESILLECIDWLAYTPLKEGDDVERIEVNSYIITWLIGSPYVSIEITDGMIAPDCPDCLIDFMCGWTKHSIINDAKEDRIANAMAGMESNIVFYHKNKELLGTIEHIEEMIKKKKEGSLQAYITAMFDAADIDK